MRGGQPTPADRGINLEHRDKLYRSISALPEGSIFTSTEVAASPEEMLDFTLMRDLDYIHLADGLCTGVVETPYLRRLPKLDLVMAAYARRLGLTLVETGDRTAWRIGIKEFEPIEGYRFHSTGPATTLSFGSAKIRLIPSRPEMMQQTPAATLFRCFHDQPAKDQAVSLSLARRATDITRERLIEAAHFGLELPDDESSAELSPSVTARRIIASLVKAEAA